MFFKIPKGTQSISLKFVENLDKRPSKDSPALVKCSHNRRKQSPVCSSIFDSLKTYRDIRVTAIFTVTCSTSFILFSQIYFTSKHNLKMLDSGCSWRRLHSVNLTSYSLVASSVAIKVLPSPYSFLPHNTASHSKRI